ncbi:hypothetical protein MNBD_ALPHA06-2333, partial [hydrothermal vent metagenome]
MTNRFDKARDLGTNNLEAFNQISEGLLPDHMG